MKKLFKRIIDTGNYPEKISFSLLFIRIIVGVFMLTHGYGKFLMLTGDGPVQFADPIGIGETSSLILTVFAEFICSILLILGVTTRLSAIPLFIAMIVAALIAHAPDPFVRKELPLLYAAVYLIIVVAGAGKYSVDHWIGKKLI